MADEPQPASSGQPSKPGRQLRTDYIKSNFFRVIYADGVYGGLTPKGDIHIDFFNERQPIPQQTTYEVTGEGRLGDEIKQERKSREAMVREVEVGVVINTDLAKALVDWLQKKIEEKEKKDKERT
ncbi:MAG: hypothetical protein HYS13_08630 [Planctomycetia bacterium]|nr:hypothetical protein [Planctomycetia bacterium]